jgi:hypothetical protein
MEGAGGAGSANTTSDSSFTRNVAQKFGRGAQKSKGRAVNNLELSVSASLLDGVLGGEAGLSLSWRDHDGTTELEEMELSFAVSGSMPVEGMDSKIVKLAGDVVTYGKQKVGALFSQAQNRRSGVPVSELLLAKGVADTTVEGVTGVPISDWVQNAISGSDTAETASEGAGSLIDSASSIGLELGFTLTKEGSKYEGSIELKHVKTMSAELPEIIKAELTRKSRLGRAKYENGSWSVSG